jgi:hypothetical protein
MTAEEMHREVCSLPGVASAEVTPRVGAPPFVRVWTDGTRPNAEVQQAVERIAVRDAPPREDATRRRAGLGRTLEDTLPAALAEPAPSHLAIDVESDRPSGHFLKLAIEETIDGVEVRAIDGAGREAGAVVAPGADGLARAVATAVASLRGFPPPHDIAANTRDVDGTTVVTVLLEMSSGTTLAGAAIVTGGLPFTVGRAVDSALNSLP